MTKPMSGRNGQSSDKRKGEGASGGNKPPHGGKPGVVKPPVIGKEETGATEAGDEDKGAKM